MSDDYGCASTCYADFELGNKKQALCQEYIMPKNAAYIVCKKIPNKYIICPCKNAVTKPVTKMLLQYV